MHSVCGPPSSRWGRRLAESGYAVLVVNPYYRTERAPVLPEGASFRDEATRKKIFPLMRSLTPETNVTDARAFDLNALPRKGRLPEREREQAQASTLRTRWPATARSCCSNPVDAAMRRRAEGYLVSGSN